jgi:predicted  nucleic acid-binding Zn-ribbon protein
MVEGLRGLFELARVDSEIAARVEQQAALPSKRDACSASRALALAKAESLKGDVEAMERTQRQHEASASDQQAVLKKLEGNQHQVKSNEVYTALLQEMEAAKTAMSEAETAVLEDMELLDQRKGQVAAAERDHAAEVESTAREEASIDDLERNVEAQLASFEAERERIGSSIDAKMLATYERVARRRSPAIAVVTGESCSGCRVGIPSQNYNEIRSAQALLTCGQCNRILIHKVHLG